MSHYDGIDALPPELQHRVVQELEPDEQLLWVGQPAPAFFVGNSFGSVLFAIPWTLFAVFWMCAAAGFQIPEFGPEMIFPLFGVPFVLVGLAMFGSPLALRYCLKKTVYVVTDHRAIVFAGTLFSMKIVSYDPDELGGLQRKEKPNGLGDIRFGDKPSDSGHAKRQTPELVPTGGFWNIPFTRDVARLLKNLAAQAPGQEEKEDEDEADHSRLATLPILRQIGDAPREIPLSLWLQLRLSSGPISLFGWIFAGFGFGFALIAVAFTGLDDAIPRNWGDAGKATITNIEKTNFHINDDSIHAYHFETSGNASEKIGGISYGYGGKYETGDVVPLQKSGNRYRLQGLTLAKAGGSPALIFLGAGSLFGIIGLCFPVYSWFAGGKAIRLLRDGSAVGAKFAGMTPTGTKVNDQPVMKVDFEYQVEGETYTASAHALDTSRLTDTKSKLVLYDPMQPEQSVVPDGLPRGVHFDETNGRFRTNPMRCVFPLLAATLVCGEIIAVIMLAIRAV